MKENQSEGRRNPFVCKQLNELGGGQKWIKSLNLEEDRMDKKFIKKSVTGRIVQYHSDMANWISEDSLEKSVNLEESGVGG